MANQKNQPHSLILQVAFEHLGNKSVSIHSLKFTLHTTIGVVKKDMAQRVKIGPEYQRCFHKGKELRDDDTIEGLHLDRDAIIFIQQTKSRRLLAAA